MLPHSISHCMPESNRPHLCQDSSIHTIKCDVLSTRRISTVMLFTVMQGRYSDLCQSLFQVGQQVANIFDTDGET